MSTPPRRRHTKARGKTRRLIEAIVRRLVQDYQPERIILFGSHAWGQPTADSDIDLLIVKDTAQAALQRRVAARLLIAQQQGATGVDLLVLTPAEVQERLALGDQFVGQIVVEGETLYAA